MQVLGIDGSLTSLGYCVMELLDGKVTVIDKGTVKTMPDLPLGERLYKIYDTLDDIFFENYIDKVCVEDVHLGGNFTASKQFMVQGIIYLKCYDKHHIPILLKPSTISKAVANNGKPPKGTRKKLLRASLEERFPNIKFKNYDESDATGVALCYLIQEGLVNDTSDDNGSD